MAAEDRSFSDLFQSIVGNVQEIVRAEVRLAKAEMREEALKAKVSGAILGAGALAAVFAGFFLLFAGYHALALIVPAWAAALATGAALAVVAGVALAAGMKRLRQVHPAPQRTVESIKENVEWAKQQIK
jgi:uncharacterized membrane protein YqjE